MEIKKKIYITTPLYYVNDQPHFGHLYSTLYGDFLQRYFSLQGSEVIFLVGCDQNGEKVYQKGLSLNQDPQEFIKLKTSKFKSLWNKMNINYRYFVETSSLDHQNYVKKIFNQLLNQKDIKLLNYKGFYCLSCENFISYQKLQNKSKICPDCQKKVTLKNEKNYFLTIDKIEKQKILSFHLKQYQKFFGFKWFKQLENLLKNQNNSFVQPCTNLSNLKKDHQKIDQLSKQSFKSSFNDQNLYFSISRFNLPCGISLGSKKENQTAYVWFDALLGYLSYLSQEEIDYFWNQKRLPFTNDQNCDSQIIHILGKEITKFHLIYWPFILKKLSYRLPDQILVHGWILNQDQKMSKSKGNVIDPLFLIEKVKSYNLDLNEKFSIDLLRLFTAFIMKTDQDIRFDVSMLDQFYQNNFLNNIWNFYYRLRTLIFKILDHNFKNQTNKWLKLSLVYQEMNKNELFNHQKLQKFIENYHTHFKNYRINNVIKEIFSLFDFANQSFDQLKLWDFKKYSYDQQINYLFYFLVIVKISALFLEPFTPYISDQILKYFGIQKEPQNWFQLKLTFVSQNDLKLLNFNNMIKLKKIKALETKN